jgi:hypothetical protein
MAATWTIESLERTFELNEESNVVTKIHWNCNDSTTVGEDTYSGRVSGTQPLDTSTLEDFVAYGDVTEEVAIGWLMDSEDEGFQDVVEAKIVAQIERQITPTEGSGIPWAVVEEVEEDDEEEAA